MKFHIFHDWTKWKPMLLVTKESNAQVVPAQHRICMECGKEEIERI